MNATAQCATATAAIPEESAFQRMWRELVCTLTGGHDTVMKFEDGRMALRCVSCGHETPGWELNETPPTTTHAGDRTRHQLARPA
jgi:hypothetical protein